MNENDPKKLARFVIESMGGVMMARLGALKDAKITVAQFCLLCALRHVNHLSMTRIATKMAFTTAAATGSIDRLEKAGMVQRLRLENDRRAIVVQATARAIDFIEKVEAEIEADFANLLEDVA